MLSKVHHIDAHDTLGLGFDGYEKDWRATKRIKVA